MLWKFNSVYNSKLQLADHERPVKYQMTLPPTREDSMDTKIIYIHKARGRQGRTLDDSTEQFVETTRMGTTA